MKTASIITWIALLMVQQASFAQTTVISDIRLIDGNGKLPGKNVDMVIKADRIWAIYLHGSNKFPTDAKMVNMSGKTMIPGLINSHAHLGLLKGPVSSAGNYSEENILRQLKKYEDFGVTQVLSMGSDHDMIAGMRDSSRQGLLPGATIFTAIHGFGALGGGPPSSMIDQVLRPQTAGEAVKMVQQLVPLKPDVLKIWVDDFGGGSPKMQPEIYTAIINEAHKNGIRVAAHVYYLEDARKLVAAGLDIIAHSIRDKEIDDDLLKAMKSKNVIYIPTLSLDEYNFIYAGKPAWLNDPFFQASIEPGLLDTLKSESYIKRLQNDPAREKKMADFRMAVQNLNKIFKAGIKVAMGTDSGAQPVRAQGFSEHLELQLMLEAGLSSLEAITCATRNGAQVLKIDHDYGSLSVGKKADFIILSGNPLENMKLSQSIVSVWRSGFKVSDGPLGK
ncbi:MAG: amidohydrolase family protein [Chitinophagaceae bacterium]